MTATRWLETDTLANQNISSALAIGAYTAGADRLIMCQVFADQVAGNGDYVMYVTLQVAGAGSAYVILPKTTMAAASGETAIGGQSGWINVRNGDVVTVYIDGLAGDTTTPDTIVRWFEDAALQPTTADTTLDIAATGEAGLDFNNIKAATAPTTLTNITVPAVTTTAAIGASGIAFNSFALGAITEDAIAANAIGASELAPSAIDEIVDQVWDELIAGHAVAGSTGATLSTAASAGGATPASLWAYASRTLTQAAATVADVVSGSSITAVRGDTLSAALTGIGALTGYVSLDFTVKLDKDDADSAAIIKIRKNASGVGDGLLYINGAAPTLSTGGSITIDDAALGNITIALAASHTDDLAPVQGLFYDVQMITATAVQTRTTGTFNVSADVTKAIT